MSKPKQHDFKFTLHMEPLDIEETKRAVSILYGFGPFGFDEAAKHIMEKTMVRLKKESEAAAQ